MGEENRLVEIEEHKNRRDEQFWFTATAIACDGVLLSRPDATHPFFAVAAAAAVSIFVVHLVLTRWLHGARRAPAWASGERDASVAARWRYTGQEVRSGIKNLPYVVAECSGSCFYLLLIALSFVAVCLKYCG